MPDFGDEIGSEMMHSNPNELQQLLQLFLRQTKNGNYQRSVGEDGQTQCTVLLENAQERDTIVEALKEQGIKFMTTKGDPPTITFDQKDLGKIQSIIEDQKTQIKTSDSVDITPRSSAVENISAAERIRSHDGGDIDSRTAVIERTTPVKGTGDFSWKADIESRVERAYEGAATEAEFITRCENQGLVVNRANDGELMFVHPDHGHWKVRADTLDERFTRQALKEKAKPVRLEEEARDMRNASKQLSAEKEMFHRDREVPNLQSLSK